MNLQISLFGSFIFTLIARILDFFMNRLDMFLKISLFRSLIITLIARISSFHVQTEYESSDFPMEKLDGYIDYKNI